MFGLTKAENKALIIIVVTLTFAALLQFFRPVQEKTINYDYSASDSLFHSIVSENRTNKQIPAVASVSITININTASSQELEKLPGIGKTIALRIIEYRNKYGFFYSYDDLLKVKGLGVKKINQLKQKIVF
jgi:competence ComEA-like helix-hairpin-helix protein